MDESTESNILRMARDDFGEVLKPIEIQRRQGGDRRDTFRQSQNSAKTILPTWAERYTKLLAFNQTQYDRITSLTLSDSTVLRVLRPPVVASYW